MWRRQEVKAILNAMVETISHGTLDPGTVLFDKGKIVAVGKDIKIPEGCDVIDGTGKYLTPGLIDAHTHVGSTEQGTPENMNDVNEKTSPVTPQLRIIDSITPWDSAFEDAIRGGVTCVQTLPGSANVIGGQGAIIKPYGKIVDEMVIKAPSAMKAALGENPIRIYSGQGKSPSTRMANAACLRDAIVKAMNYAAKKSHAREKKDFFERDLMWESLEKVVNKEICLSIHAHRADDIVTALRIVGEFGLECTIEHGTEGHLIAEYLAEKRVKVAVGPTLANKSKLELKNLNWETPKILLLRGVHVCITTDHPVVPLQYLSVCAALAFRAGLSREEALKCITLYSAEHLGVEDRMGSIEEGKDADMVLWNGDPLDCRSEVMTTIINGEVVYKKEGR